jgi:hypothetical protein
MIDIFAIENCREKRKEKGKSWGEHFELMKRIVSQRRMTPIHPFQSPWCQAQNF